MPDDPQARAQLDAALERVRRAFPGKRGRPDWGDSLPHHPDQRPGMSYEAVEALHRRPAELPVSELSWAEVDYFFDNTGYTLKPYETVREAFPYFLPRLAELVAFVQPPAGFLLPARVIFERLDMVHWQRWKPAWRAAVADWLAGWGAVVLHWECEHWQQDGCYLGPWDPEHRRVDGCLEALLLAAGFDLLAPSFDRLSPIGWVRVVRGLIPYGEFSLPNEGALVFDNRTWPTDVPAERQRALLGRVARADVAEAILNAPAPPGVAATDWQEACIEAASTVERLRHRMTMPH